LENKVFDIIDARCLREVLSVRLHQKTNFVSVPPPHNFLTRIATKNPFAANEIGLTVNRNSFLWHYHLKHRLLQNPLRGLGHGAKQTHVLFGT
jgi:hypothetical protein